MSTQPNRDNYRMAVYVISVAAELAGMHPQTLRNYERVGLLRPARTQGGNRRYSDADIQLLQRIARLAFAMCSNSKRRSQNCSAKSTRCAATSRVSAHHAANSCPPARCCRCSPAARVFSETAKEA
jgi:MerR family transcriptional regulator/heat shock protein HspR